MNGIVLLGTLPGSAADENGLRYGDVLLSVNGKPMSSVEDFLNARSLAKETMQILVRRGDHVLELSLDLKKRVGPEGLERVVTELSRASQPAKPGVLPN